MFGSRLEAQERANSEKVKQLLYKMVAMKVLYHLS